MVYNKIMKKIMLIYPPGEIYQRSEDRCQININASVSNSIRACNDLGYISAILKQENYNIFLKDYPAENLTIETFFNDIKNENPDVVFISTTNGSILYDLDIVKKIKSIKKDTIIILKGALFFNPEQDLYKELDLNEVDYLIGGESEFIILPLLIAHFNDFSLLDNIQGISYKQNGEWKTNKLTEFCQNLDSIPFPDREIMKNELYINPATNNPIATISTSRGCPSSCIYCVSPIISGKEVRFRSPKSVLEELKECYFKYNIKEFFFKSDTFTINKKWVIELCDYIINSDLSGKINWVANSKVNTLDEEMLSKMKAAGCTLIALGIESGNEESLKRMKKGTTIAQNIATVKLIKKYGLKIFGFYLIGFPWENTKHISDTEKLIFALDTDFIEISIATPFKGSELYNMVFEKNGDKKNILGKDSFKNITTGTDFLSKEKLEAIRKKIILKYHLRPSFILKKLFNKEIKLCILKNYIKYGIRLLKNIFNP